MKNDMVSISKYENLKIAWLRLLTNQEGQYKNYFRDIYDAYALTSEENLKILQKRIKSGYVANKPVKVFSPKANGLTTRQFTLLNIVFGNLYSD